VFENRVLRRILDIRGSDRRMEKTVTRSFVTRMLHQILFKVIKSKRMRWAEHVPRMEKREMLTKFLSENPKGRDHFEDLGVNGKIIL
jgi:hypothetical protein